MKTMAWARTLGVVIALSVALPGIGFAAPAKSAPGKSAPKEAKEEEKEGIIAGLTIPRTKGGFLGLAVDGGGFKLSFYNEKKKPIAIDVAQATARFQPKKRPGQMHVVLNPTGDSKALASQEFVPPPRVFKVFLTLLDASGQAVENYTVDFSG
jgi:hypothetical protein